MKKQRKPAEINAQRAARNSAWRISIFGLILGVLLLSLSYEFIQLHCVALIILTLFAGFTVGRNILHIYPDIAGAAGSTGGMVVGVAYALPFMVAAARRWITLDESEVAKRIAEFSPQQAALLSQQNILPNLEYFKAGEVSYFFAYLIFAFFFGWLFGMIGGLLARRRFR
jgi:hypothetical protein